MMTWAGSSGLMGCCAFTEQKPSSSGNRWYDRYGKYCCQSLYKKDELLVIKHPFPMLCDQSLCPKILTPVAGGQHLHPSQPPKSGETGVIGSGAAKYHSLQFFESQGARPGSCWLWEVLGWGVS